MFILNTIDTLDANAFKLSILLAQKSFANEPSMKGEVGRKPPILIQTSPTIDDDEEEVEEDIEKPTIIKVSLLVATWCIFNLFILIAQRCFCRM